MYDVSLGHELGLNVIPQNVLKEQLGFCTFDIFETDMLKSCREIVDNFDGKVDFVDM